MRYKERLKLMSAFFSEVTKQLLFDHTGLRAVGMRLIDKELSQVMAEHTAKAVKEAFEAGWEARVLSDEERRKGVRHSSFDKELQANLYAKEQGWIE